VLALTVDPAGRLADSLGVSKTIGGAQPITPERLSQLRIAGDGQLSVSILDAQRTLRQLVERLAPDQTALSGIVGHPLFRYLSDYLAGANEVLAMEKLLEALDSEEHDLIVLDTPPTRHALDFLRGPEWLNDAMSGPILKALVRAVDGRRRFSLDWVGQRVAGMVSSFAKLSGSETLEQVATLLWELRGIFGGLGQRAERLANAFRDPSFAYVMVSRPAREALGDAAAFARELNERSMSPELLIVNRVHEVLEEREARLALERLETLAGPELASSISQAAVAHLLLVESEQSRIREARSEPALMNIPHWQLPSIAGGVRGLDDLANLADQLEIAAARP
jgi:anion-transporting  ArsA/GET3 family ATPase